MVETALDIHEQIRQYVQQPFGQFVELFRMQVQVHPEKAALIDGRETFSYAVLDGISDRIAAGLQRDGIEKGGRVAICATMSVRYVAVFLGILKAGAIVCPLSPLATPAQLLTMLRDCGAGHLSLDERASRHLESVLPEVGAKLLALYDGEPGEQPSDWLPAEGARPRPVPVAPKDPFNILYSSGTTGTPKGIVQPHSMRWPQLHLLDPPGYGPEAVAIISTPLYSNTTLVSLLPALAGGGTVVLMPRFDARGFLELCQRYRVTTAMLVPVQFRRILDVPDFDSFDLSSFQIKYATSAPFPAEWKAETLRRWPGGLVEYYGMTEGGGAFMLVAHLRPDKLHTVGQSIEGHDMRVIDDTGREVPSGEAGEVVGRSMVMMTGYHNQPGKTAEAEWFSPEGDRFIRTGDIGKFDDEGFLTLIGRKKDMIISGGMNIYPSDLEAVLSEHPAVLEAAVVGARSQRWGETPVGFVVLRDHARITGDALKEWANARLGKMQRLAEVRPLPEMPRSAVGKILKRELQTKLAEKPVE